MSAICSPFLDLLSEMMILDVEVLCSGSHLGYLCYLNCSFIILKDFTLQWTLHVFALTLIPFF
jgi:hypothetical protein